MKSLKEHKEINENFLPLVNVTRNDVKKLVNGEDVVIGKFTVNIVNDIGDDIHAFVDINEGVLLEKRIRQTKRMKNSNSVVSATNKELFGPDGKYSAQVKKIFKLFKTEVKKKAKELGVPVGNVRNWKITLKDHTSKDLNKKI